MSVKSVKRLAILSLILLLGGCAGGTTPATKTSTPASLPGASGELAELRAVAAKSKQRIDELEARIALLEQESRSLREQGRFKPTETVRIGEPRKRPRPAAKPAPAKDDRPRPVIRLHNAPPPRGSEPLALPKAPPGVPTRLPVAPLPGKRTLPFSSQPPATDDARAAYREALGLVRARDYATALQKLDGFLARFGEHSLSDNAVYWRGEVHYAQRNYQRALKEFEAVLARYPGSNKAADALLKIAMCHHRLGDKQKAAKHFDLVRKQYPNSDAARIASREGSS